jgi:hypothetical protein
VLNCRACRSSTAQRTAQPLGPEIPELGFYRSHASPEVVGFVSDASSSAFRLLGGLAFDIIDIITLSPDTRLP